MTAYCNWGQAPFSEVPVPFHVSPTAAVFAAHPADSTVRPAFTQSTILDGYDAWGRITGLRHSKVAGDTDIVKLEYGYSKGSDRLYQKNVMTGEGSQSELYAYDALHRLTSFKRGTLNAANDAITDGAEKITKTHLDAVLLDGAATGQYAPPRRRQR